MTTVTFFFLTLFTWMVSSGTRCRLDQFCELSRYGYDEERQGLNSSNKMALMCDKIKPPLSCERFPEMSTSLERTFKQDRVDNDCGFFPCVDLDDILFNQCGKLLQASREMMNEEKPNTRVCACHFQRDTLFFPYFMSDTDCLLFTVEITTVNSSTLLNYRSIHPSSDFLGSLDPCSKILNIHIAALDHWNRVGWFSVCQAGNLEGANLREPLCRDFQLFVKLHFLKLSQRQESLTSSLESDKTCVKICYVQMPANFYSPHCPQEVFLSQAGIEENLRSACIRRWVARCFLVALLLLGLNVTRAKTSPHRGLPDHGGNHTVVMLFTMTWHWFSASLSVHQVFEWSCTATRMSSVFSLSCALGRTVHVLFVYRTSHTFIKLLCSTQQHFRALPILVYFVWSIPILAFANKSLTHWFEDILLEDTVGPTLRAWTVSQQTLYQAFVSLPGLLVCILKF